MVSKTNEVLIYQAANGAVEVRLDQGKETLLLTQQQVAQLFDVQKAAVSKHLNSIFATKELDQNSTVSILETVQQEGKRKIIRKIEYYNLDLIISIGYRVNSANATKFRQWATKTLRQHITQGYTINPNHLTKNYEAFMQAVEEAKKLLPATQGQMKAEDVLELVKAFANTWFSLDAYDKTALPSGGVTKKKVKLTADEFNKALAELKTELMRKGEATDFFAQEKQQGSIEGIIGNVLQSFDQQELYPTVEEKAAHLLYFIIKNHPFTDGNKRSGAFAFIWFLRKAKRLDIHRLTPEALTALTLFVAESDPKDKPRMTGLVLMLLK